MKAEGRPRPKPFTEPFQVKVRLYWNHENVAQG